MWINGAKFRFYAKPNNTLLSMPAYVTLGKRRTNHVDKKGEKGFWSGEWSNICLECRKLLDGYGMACMQHSQMESGTQTWASNHKRRIDTRRCKDSEQTRLQYGWQGSRYVCPAAEQHTGGFWKLNQNIVLGCSFRNVTPWRRKEGRQKIYQILSIFLHTMCKLFYPLIFKYDSWLYSLIEYSQNMLESSKAKIAAPKVSAIIVFVSIWDVSIKFYQASAVDMPGV